MTRNIALYPWFRFFQNLLFWQAVWFLVFQSRLSAAEAILLYVVYDVTTTALEVPSGYMSDRWGRRITLIASAVCGVLAALLLATGNSFAALALGQAVMGASMAFASGTDTALLYESLAATDRADETEAQELRAWRFSFTALALSAVTGGAMALWFQTLPFFATALGFAGMLGIALRFSEPRHSHPEPPQGAEVTRLGSLGAALRDPVLAWLFVLGAVMYVFSHVPYIFGQPFILEALRHAGYAAEAPLVSGAVTSTMMVVSVLASLFALQLRRAIGLPAILLLAFAMQIGVIAVLMLTDSMLAIAVLFLRMVPDSLSRPFILARIQPVLSNQSRATYLSLRSLFARLIFAVTLWSASLSASSVGDMAHTEIATVLGWYTAVGLVVLAVLALVARRLPIEPT